jgi:multidrug resistance protein, MATE family
MTRRGSGRDRLDDPVVRASGLPIGYALAFGFGRGIVGLWVGLTIGLVLAGLANLATWARKARRLREGRERTVIE